MSDVDTPMRVCYYRRTSPDPKLVKRWLRPSALCRLTHSDAPALFVGGVAGDDINQVGSKHAAPIIISLSCILSSRPLHIGDATTHRVGLATAG